MSIDSVTMNTVTIDMEHISIEELDELIKEAKRLRSRKNGAREAFCGLENLLEGAKDRGYTFCSKTTGEVLRAKDWVVYDEEEQRVQEGKWMSK